MEIEKDAKFAPHCSIPSKYQRIIFPHPLKKAARGFGINTNRFNQSYEIASKFNRDAGPGNYTFQNPENRSVSKTGYSGISSKTERVSKTRLSTLGPGTYDVCNSVLRKGMPIISESKCPVITDKGILKIPFDESNPLSYIKPVTLKIYLKNSNPGPGEYDTSVQPQVDSENSQWMFVSQSKRNRVPKVASTHETYINSSSILKQNNVAKNCFSENENKSLLNKLSALSNVAGDIGYALNESFNGEGPFLNYDRLQKVIQNNCTQKSLRRKSEMAANESLKKVNYTMQNTEDDRFGVKVKSRIPKAMGLGPGEYNAIPQNCKAIRAPFKSKLPKMAKIANNKNPGPAYYKNTVEPSTYSFHRNFGNKWV